MDLIAATYGLVRLAYGLLLPDISVSLGLHAGGAGRISSAASVAYCLGAVCGLTARRRSRELVTAAMATASLGSLGMAAAGDLATFAVSTVIASVGAGLASPALAVVIERSVAEARRDRAQARVNAGTGPGLVLAGILAIVLLPHWRLALVIAAVVTTVTGLGVLALDRRSAATPAPPVPRDRPALQWLGALTVPALAALTLGATSAVVWTFGRSLLIDSGAGGSASTLAWITLGAGGTLTLLTAGRLGSWSPMHAWLVSTAGIALAIAVLGLAADRIVVALLACALFGWGFVAATSALISWAARLAPDRVGPGVSVLFVTLVLGQAVGSSVWGGIIEHQSMQRAFVLAAAVTALSALTALLPVTRFADAEPGEFVPADC